MLEFFRIFHNEWSKLIHRKRFLVVLLLGLALISFYVYTQHSNSERMQHMSDPAVQAEMMDVQIKQMEFDLKNNTKLNDDQRKNIQQNIDKLKQNKSNLEQRAADNGADNGAGNGAANGQPPEQTREQLQQMIDTKKATLAALTSDQVAQKGDLELNIKILEYQLEHPTSDRGFSMTAWRAIVDFLDVGSQVFIPLLAVLLVADMVSGEQTGGTIKLLLTRPVSRSKILFAKYITAITGAALVTLILCAALAGGLLATFGTKGDIDPIAVGVKYHPVNSLTAQGMMGENLAADASEAKVIPMKTFAIQSILLTLLASVAMSTLGFFSSVIVRSAAVSTGISMAVVIIGTILVHSARGATWMKFFITPHFDLPYAWSGRLSQELGMSMSLNQSLLVLLVWTVGLYTIGHLFFKNRDILA